MKHMKKTFSVLLALILFITLLPASLVLAEDGTTATIGDCEFEVDEEGNYLIQSKEDWNNLSSAVRNKNTCEGITFLQTADISVTRPVGGWVRTNSNGSGYKTYFCGNYNGGNHTLTVDLNSGDEYYNPDTSRMSNYCAPFPYVSGVEITNLHVTGNITTDKKFAAGLVGAALDGGRFDNIHVSVTISAGGSRTTDGTHGGIIAIVESKELVPDGDYVTEKDLKDLSGLSFQITNCTFDGAMLCTTPNKLVKNCGGIVGYGKSPITMENCLFAPSELTISTSGSEVFARLTGAGSVTCTDCYYTEEFGSKLPKSGVAQVVTELPENGTLYVVKEVNGTTVYIPQNEQSVMGYSLTLTGSVGLVFYVTEPEGATDCNMTFTISGRGTVSSDPHIADETHTDTESGATYYGYTCTVNALQMADEITATFHATVNGNEVISSRSYSVIKFVDRIISNPTKYDEETVDLAEALADYGHYLQIYLSGLHGFGLGDGDDQYAPINTYDKQMTSEELTSAQNGVSAYEIVRPTTKDIEKITYSVSFESDSTINVYVAPVSGYKGAFDATISPERSGNRYVMHIAGIQPTEFANTQTIAYTTDSGSETIKTSVLAYANTLFASRNAGAKEAAAATYYYYTAAQAYVNKD